MSKVLKLDRRWLPLLGPLLLFALWQLLISAQFVKPVLLPPPGATLAHMASVFASGAIFGDQATITIRNTTFFNNYANRGHTGGTGANDARSCGCSPSATGAELATFVRASYGPGVRARGRRNRKVPSAAAGVVASWRPPA